MFEEIKVPTGIVNFLHKDNKESIGFYIAQEDLLTIRIRLEALIERVLDTDSNFLNYTVFNELDKFHKMISEIDNPKSVVFIETDF